MRKALQWGRGKKASEIDTGEVGRAVYRPASMGPRQKSLGNVYHITEGSKYTKSFNGAEAKKPRKWHYYALVVARLRRFNGAEAKKPRKSLHKVIDSVFGLASMGPRQKSLGNLVASIVLI